MAGFCQINGDPISDATVILRNCRRCKYYTPSGYYGCYDFKPTVGR